MQNKNQKLIINNQFYTGLAVCFLIINLTIYFILCGKSLGNWDNQAYAYTSLDFIRNLRFYSDTWIDKPPGAILMYIPVIALPKLSGMNLYFVLTLAIENFFIFAICRRLGFSAEDALIGVLSIMCFVFLTESDLNWLSLSHLSNILILGAILLLTFANTPYLVASGILIGFSFYVRQNNLLFLFVPILLLWPISQTKLLAYILGAFIGFIGFGLMFWCLSEGNLFWFTTFEYPALYQQSNIANSNQSWFLMINFFISELTLPLGLFLLCSGLFYWRQKNCLNIIEKLTVSPINLASMFLIILMIILAPAKPWLHYLGYMILWIGILGAWGWYQVRTIIIFKNKLIQPCFVISLCLAFTITFSYQSHKTSISLTGSSQIDVALNALVNATPLTPSTTLQIFGPGLNGNDSLTSSLLLRLTNLKSPNRLFHFIYFTGSFMQAVMPAFGDPWKLLYQTPPDLMMVYPLQLADLEKSLGFGINQNVNEFLESHCYKTVYKNDEFFIAKLCKD